MEKTSTDRPFLKFIAYLQVIGIILVVLGHSFHEYPDGDAHGKTFVIYRMIYSFHMPLFMFVSGFLMLLTSGLLSQSPRYSFGKFFKNKVLRLLLPFFVLTLVTFVPRCMMSSMADESLQLSLKSLAGSFIWYDNLVIPYFWFLQASFILLIVNFLILTIAFKKKIDSGALILALSGVSLLIYFMPIDYPGFFSFDKAMQLAVFFTAGMAYCRYFRSINNLIDWTSPWCLSAFTALWVISFATTENTPAFILCSFSGIAASTSLAMIIQHRGITVIDHLSGANYIIFLLSWYFNVIFQQVLHHYIELPWWVYTIMSLIAGIYIPWLFYRYMQRHPQFYFVKITARLLGQSIKTP